MKRNGFTLLEILLVMSLIVIGATLAFPIYDEFFDPHNLDVGVSKAWMELTETRSLAMSESTAYRFSIKENTGEFRIEPDDPADTEEQIVSEGTLPKQCLFVQSTEAVPSENPTPGSEWQTVVVFLPDGSARQGGELLIGVKGLTPARIRIRDLTGSLSLEKNLPEAQP